MSAILVYCIFFFASPPGTLQCGKATLFPIFRKPTQMKSITVIQLLFRVDSYLHKCTHMQLTVIEAMEARRDQLAQRQTLAFHLPNLHTDNKRRVRQNEIGQQSQVICKAIKINEISMQMREVILREEPQTMQCSLWEEGNVQAANCGYLWTPFSINSAIALFINHLNAWPDMHFEIHNVLTEFGKYSHIKWPLFQFMLINISSYQGITIFRTRGKYGWMEIYIQNSAVWEVIEG